MERLFDSVYHSFRQMTDERKTGHFRLEFFVVVVVVCLIYNDTTLKNVL